MRSSKVVGTRPLTDSKITRVDIWGTQTPGVSQLPVLTAATSTILSNSTTLIQSCMSDILPDEVLD